jgi:hypothetical protein
MGSIDIGDTYPYWNYIKTPQNLGITSDGNFPAFMKDVGGLFDYGELLILSKSNASTTGNALGNKYFLNTGGQCCPTTVDNPWSNTPCSSSSLVDRYIFMNNIPTGNLPFITSSGNSNGEFTGILPGILEDVFKIPIEIEGLFSALTQEPNPPCIPLELAVTDINNNTSMQTQYVASSDVIGMSPSDFPNNKIPISESFINMNNQYMNIENKQDPIITLYFILLIILAIYLFYRLFYFSRN